MKPVLAILRCDRISSFYIVNMLISNQVTNCNWIHEYLNSWILEYLSTWILEYLNTFVFCYFHVGYSILLEFLLEVVWNPQDLLLMMGTEISKIDAEMAEKIEVGVGTFTTEVIFLLFCQFLNEPHWTSKSIGFQKGWLYLHYLLRPRDATASKKGLESSWYQLSWMLHVNVM